MSPEDCNRRLMLDNFHAAGCFISSDNQLPFIKQLNQLWTHLSVELNLQPLTKMPRRRCWTLDATCFTSWGRFRTGTNSKGLKLHDLRSGQIPDVEIKKKGKTQNVVSYDSSKRTAAHSSAYSERNQRSDLRDPVYPLCASFLFLSYNPDNTQLLE